MLVLAFAVLLLTTTAVAPVNCVGYWLTGTVTATPDGVSAPLLLAETEAGGAGFVFHY